MATDDRVGLGKTANGGAPREPNGPPAGESPSAEEKRAALDQVLQRAHFERADQLRSFLRFVCEMELSGRGSELNEHLIGVEALGRPPGYSTTDDSSVRRCAHTLRLKLEEAYATDLAGARVRIELPRGGYQPRFHRASPAARADTEGKRPLPSATRFGPPCLLAAFALGALAGAGALRLSLRPATTRLDPVLTEAWGPLARPGAKPLICLSAPPHYGILAYPEGPLPPKVVEYVHTHVRELMTNYGKIDVLWYDVAWPLDASGWESGKMNEMVFRLQPDILVNNRNKLPGDFTTPEQRVEAATEGRAWETCMTLNSSWGYHAADDDWKTPRQVVRNLVTCTRDGGNYLLNVGPRADGTVPQESVSILGTVGRWLERNGAAIYGADRCQPRRSNYAGFTRRGSTLYMHVHFWPGESFAMAGLLVPARSVRLLANGQGVAFQQDKLRLRFTGLPATAPDDPVTTLAVECDGEPKQDQYVVRNERDREVV